MTPPSNGGLAMARNDDSGVAGRTSRWRSTARPIISVTTFFLVWELIGRAGVVPPALFPTPSRVALALWEMARSVTRAFPDSFPLALRSDLAFDVFVSLQRAIMGWALGSVTGIVAGVATGRIRLLDAYLTPIVQLFRPLPPVAIIPIIIVWFGIGEGSKIFSIAFAVFFPVWINTHLGAQKVSQSFVWSARSLGASSWRVLTHVVVPGALPFIIAGLRTGVAVSFVMVYVSELAGASAGIGYEISTSHLAYRVDRMMAALLILGALGSGADFGLTRVLNRLFPWLRYASQK